ncbi:pyrroline-5-carboxylate reductase [Limibaculum sp. FT325]|uniref:pyrroline-5-carboxylate reductase n=1 Tax=Thermohalobaculum sediminis TaxID=2939436 RepID=UPI0020C08DFB|nr:pyrroline-5-carboxylate reductase [Limibaculum sediminis]MCL5778437.1 pyrroline-5-carboxylate reductase [Limibaculum sediminis]
MAGLQNAGVETLVLLGCGKMGGAMLEGWLAGGLSPAAVTVIEPRPSERVKVLAGEGLVLNPTSLAPASVAIIAVKPQMMGDAAPALMPLAGQGTVFVSIAAGTPIAAFEAMFGAGTPIVRAMPNTPAAVGRGITALIGNIAADERVMAMAEALLAAVGQTVRLESEDQMDAVTGLSGSGPAYVFHMIEAMAAAGEAAGLAPDLAMRLARATVCGAGALAVASDESAAQLRINVTSPGGTTAAGLGVLMAELPGLMTRTVAAATQRSRELRG